MQNIEDYLPPFQQTHLTATHMPIVAGHATAATVTTTGTLTAAQVATGYIISGATGTAAMTLTLPTGTLLGANLGAARGDALDLFVDNTGGLATITVAVGTNGILSSAANSAGTTGVPVFGYLTVATGATGIGRFTLTFASSTAYVFSRTA